LEESVATTDFIKYSGFSRYLILKEEFPAILWQKLQHAVFVCGSCHF
jgi:hypothetical protein